MLVISGRTGQALSGARHCCFNLAIEMLVISGEEIPHRLLNPVPMFQSRNRDACHFRTFSFEGHRNYIFISFNLAIEMLVISGSSDA